MANANTNENNVRTSVASLYAQLVKRREEERAEKEKKKREKKEQEQAEKDAAETKEDGTKLTKKEKRQKEIENWQEVIFGLTGEDLEYTSEKKSKKKKYTKWITDDLESDNLTKKPKKPKKRNYKKEFDPELTMLKNLVNEQNRFTTDLQRRFNYAVGPASKDAAPLNKTMVELASAINVSRSNSLTTLRTISDLKKTVAQLYHKQAEIDMKKSGSGDSSSDNDLSILGSSIIRGLDDLNNPYLAPINGTPTPQVIQTQPPINTPIQQVSPSSYTGNANYQTKSTGDEVYSPNNSTGTAEFKLSSTGGQVQQQIPNIELSISDFDARTWVGPELPDKQVMTENTPHEIVVMRDKTNGSTRFAAIEPGTDREIPDFPVPSYDPSDRPISETDHRMKGYFDDSYRVIDV